MCVCVCVRVSVHVSQEDEIACIHPENQHMCECGCEQQSVGAYTVHVFAPTTWLWPTHLASSSRRCGILLDLL
jgi:hypothetical protein